MTRLVVDLDNTLTLGAEDGYAAALPNQPLIERLREYRTAGYDIVIHTSRNMRTHQGNVGKINVHTLPVIMAWLQEHQVPFDEIIVGKPWCGHDGFYVDDRAVRPAEFVRHSADELRQLIDADRARA